VIERDKNPREVYSPSAAVQSGPRAWRENAIAGKISPQVLGYLAILAEDFPFDADDTKNGHSWRKTVV